MFISKYSILEKVHQGRKFNVYLASKAEDQQTCYIKVLQKSSARKYDTDLNKSLKSEYEYLNKFNSSNIISAENWIDDSEYAILELEDSGGTSIKKHLENFDPFTPKDFLPVAINCVKGLIDVHSQGLIHNDINNNNLVWNPDTGSLKIIDFDIAHEFDSRSSFMGNPEKLQGTLEYISPEQTGRLNQWVDQRTDLYSLGISFYELLTGCLPFKLSDPLDLVYHHITKVPTVPSELNPGIPGVLSDLVMKLIEKDPKNRYQSASGLLNDLEIMLGNGFEKFDLGKKDIPQRFYLATKLYGREKEVEILKNTYKKIKDQGKGAILVSGYSGTGKTALVNTIHSHITRDNGFYIDGKFDQLQKSVPYFAIAQAFNKFCDLILLENSSLFEEWKSRISDSLGSLGQVLVDVIPKLEMIIGPQPKPIAVGAEETERRFNFEFLEFIRVIATPQNPLVIFIDDLQWADLSSLKLIKLMLEDESISNFLFIGAYRDNEVTSMHPLMSTLEEIQKKSVEIPAISVSNLAFEDIQNWIMDSLKREPDSQLKELASIVFEKTNGNAFFTGQFLEELYEDNLLYFNAEEAKWVWDVEAIRNKQYSDNVIDLLSLRIKKLPEDVKSLLRFASCLGNNVDLKTLFIISEQSIEAQQLLLDYALKAKVIYQDDIDSVKFVHDRVQQAVYSIFSIEEMKPIHYQIGSLLKAKIQEEEGSQKSLYLFDAANHLNIAASLISTEAERLKLAKLNLSAAKEARLSGAFSIANEYIDFALQNLPVARWEKFFALTLETYNEAIQIAYMNGDYEQLEQQIQTVLNLTDSILDQKYAYQYKMMVHMAQNEAEKTISTFLHVCKELGLVLPKKPGTPQIIFNVLRLPSMSKEKNRKKLENMPYVTDPKDKLLAWFFTTGITGAMHGSTNLIPILSAKMVEFTFKRGLSAESPFIFSFYGVIKNSMGDISGAYQIGEIILKLLHLIPESSIVKPRTLVMAYFYMLSWKLPFKKVAEKLLENHHFAVSIGDFEYAAYSIAIHAMFTSRTEISLPETKSSLESAIETMRKMNQHPPTLMPIVENEYVSRLLDPELLEPASLQIDTDSLFKETTRDTYIYALYVLTLRRVTLAFLFEKYESLEEYLDETEKIYKSLEMFIVFFKSDYSFFAGLSYISLVDIPEKAGKKSTLIKKAKKLAKVMKKWAKLGPENFLHKFYLIQAEIERVTGYFEKAAALYEKAIEQAILSEYTNEAAIACELAAKFYMKRGQDKIAAVYFADARMYYRKWGAQAKVKHLEETYPKYFDQYAGSRAGNVVSIGPSTTSADIDEMLDFKSILDASQVLSGDLKLSSLLENMMLILIKNAGAQRGVLIINKDDKLVIQAEGQMDGTVNVLQEQSVEASEKILNSVVNYVQRTGQSLVFDNISENLDYAEDAFVKENQLKSLVCFPIIKQEHLIGILYLENNSVEGAFTKARMKMLNMLSSQIAISLENAELVSNLDEKVQERTRDLNQALNDLEVQHKTLQDTQTQLVQTEKMAGLGTVVAGVAHEINNPVNFIYMSGQNLTNDLDEFKIKLLEMVEEDPVAIQFFNEKFDRFSSSLERINEGGERIRSIVGDLRTFSRLGEARWKKVKLAEGIRASLHLVETLYKDTIKFITDFDFDPLVDCLPGQLNQVFFNLISNACQAIEEKRKQLNGEPGKLEIKSFQQDEMLCVRFLDNGIGMDETTLNKMFDPFFTTKEVGEGTGLGLAISFNIIKNHRGKFEVDSEPGRGTEISVLIPIRNQEQAGSDS